MAEENVWKKQMLANKSKLTQNKPSTPRSGDSNNTSPSQPPWVKNNNAPTTNQAPPPWAKNNVPETTTTTPPPWVKNNNPPPTKTETTTQPPWMKNNNPTTNTVSPPPWMKNNTSAETSNPSTGSTPPWAKSNSNTDKTISQPQSKSLTPIITSTQSQPPWAKGNVSPSNSTNQPAWMNKNNSAGSHDWKIKQASEQEIRKKEEEEKRRLQKEQEEKHKKEQELRQKQIEQNNIKRELDLMKIQDQLSRNREQYDEEVIRAKIEEEKRQMEEQQRQKLRQLQAAMELQRIQKEKMQKQRLEKEEKQKMEQFQMNKSKAKQSRRSKKDLNFQNSKISHISSIKGFQNLQQPTDRQHHNYPLSNNLFHRYLHLINEQSHESDYKSKIQIQRKIIQLQLQFRQESSNELIQLLQKKKVTNRRRKVVFSNNMQIQYALIEGRKSQKKLQFMTEEVEELRNRFLQYQLLTRCIMGLLKKKMSLHLRLPLMNFGEYKGVSFIIEYTCQQLVDIIQMEVGLFQEIANQLTILEKQIQLNSDSKYENVKPINKDNLMVKKISINEEDYFVLYVKPQQKDSTKNKRGSESTIKNQKSDKSYSHIGSFNDIKFLQAIISQNSLLPYYTPSLSLSKNNLDLYSKTASPALKQIIKQISLAKAIQTVYCSCQGEVNEQSFFQLVLQGNKQIWDMIHFAGYTHKQIPTAACLAYLQSSISLRFNFTSQLYSKRSKQIIKTTSPSIYIQRHEFELLQFMRNLQRYIFEDKQELVEQSLQMNRAIWQQIQKYNNNDFNFLQIKNEVSYLLYNKKQELALKLLDKNRENISTLAIEQIPVALLYLKIYVSIDAEIPLLKKLHELLEVLQFYFQEETLIHAYVYTIVGTYYSRKDGESSTEQQKKVITFYQHALNIALKLYGQKAQEVAEIYLNRATAFISLKRFQLFHRDIQQALKIYKAHSKSGTRLAECYHLLGKAQCLEGHQAEGVEVMENSSNMFLKMENYMQALRIDFEVLPFLERDQNQLEAKIQAIVDICFTYKSVWAFKRAVTIILDRQLNCYTSLNEGHLKELFPQTQQQQQSQQQILINLQEQIRGFTSFIEIVRWSLSILAARIVTRREVTSDYEKAHNIMREVFHFYSTNSNPEYLKESHLL